MGCGRLAVRFFINVHLETPHTITSVVLTSVGFVIVIGSQQSHAIIFLFFQTRIEFSRSLKKEMQVTALE